MRICGEGIAGHGSIMLIFRWTPSETRDCSAMLCAWLFGALKSVRIEVPGKGRKAGTVPRNFNAECWLFGVRDVPPLPFLRKIVG